MPRTIEEPTEEIKKQMYEMYKVVFNSSFTERKKLNLMTSITGWEPWSWRVVGISTDAVAKVVEYKGNAKVAKELVRDHYFQGRTETYKKMLSNLLSFEDWWSEFWKNDRTILITRDQHNKAKFDRFVGMPTNFFEIDWKYGFFQSGKVAGFVFSKKYEGNFIISNFASEIYTNERGYVLKKNVKLD